MEEWNVLATSLRYMGRKLKRQLSPFGKFRYTEYRDVLVGWVDNRAHFLQGLEEEYEKFPFNLSALSKVIPIDTTFEFTVDDFLDKAKEAVKHFIEKIDDNAFHIRIERRGHKGELDSHKLEQLIGEHLHTELEKLGRHPTTEFKDPDMVVVIETLTDRAGVALITRELEKECRFVRIR